MTDKEIDEETLQDLYAWIDKIPLSRPKRNIARDFSDGVMIAEVVKHFFPKFVDLHNYSPVHSTHQKLDNWATLNRKVFSKFNFHVTEETAKKIAASIGGVIEPILLGLRERIEEKMRQQNITETQVMEYYNTTGKTDDLQVPIEAKLSFGLNKEARAARGLHVDPAILKIIDERDQALITLRQTVEVLQIKVSRLEHLVQLKDLHIVELTKQIEHHKMNAKM